MQTLQNTREHFLFLIAVYEVWWQTISLLHSLTLVPALTSRSRTSSLCEGHASHKAKVMLDTSCTSSSSKCRAAVWFTSTRSVTGTGYHLVSVQGTKTYTTGQKLGVENDEKD